MNTRMIGAALAFGLLVAGVGQVTAETKVFVTREENKPKAVEINAGEEVRFVNHSGGNAHLWFAGQDGVKFYLGGKDGGLVKFDTPGTYQYSVHISGTKVHAHTGTVVVK